MPATRELTIVAQDPGVRRRGKIVTARVTVPREALAPGPRGYRAHVVDYDSATHSLYAAHPHPGLDEWASATNRELLGNPSFHAQNVYAIVMRTLTRFEHALGRRVSWGFGGHQIKIAPHAFYGANAFYSREHEALLFGYFRSRKVPIYTCLSHDIVAHEAAHALLDGIRERYTDPSLPDQPAFHEGFADLVAMLSMFSLPEVVELALPERPRRGKWLFRNSLLLAIAKQIGSEVSGRRSAELRRSVAIRPDPSLLSLAEYQDPHRRGEILVAAVLNAFLETWERRAVGIQDRSQAIAQGAEVADYLLTLAIRALDYAPPVDISFGDYLSAVLIADYESSRGEDRFGIRSALNRSFGAFGIVATPPKKTPSSLEYKHTHFEAMQRDSNEVFNFLWENRTKLLLHEEAYTRVLSVRPCVRVAQDGFSLRETVAEYVQVLRLQAGELERMKPAIRKPAGMDDRQQVSLYGGGTLVFDEFGGMKYHVANSIADFRRQSARLRHLWETGYFDATRQQSKRNGTGKRPHSHVRGRSWRLLSAPVSLPRSS